MITLEHKAQSVIACESFRVPMSATVEKDPSCYGPIINRLCKYVHCSTNERTTSSSPTITITSISRIISQIWTLDLSDLMTRECDEISRSK